MTSCYNLSHASGIDFLTSQVFQLHRRKATHKNREFISYGHASPYRPWVAPTTASDEEKEPHCKTWNLAFRPHCQMARRYKLEMQLYRVPLGFDFDEKERGDGEEPKNSFSFCSISHCRETSWTAVLSFPYSTSFPPPYTNWPRSEPSSQLLIVFNLRLHISLDPRLSQQPEFRRELSLGLSDGLNFEDQVQTPTCLRK